MKSKAKMSSKDIHLEILKLQHEEEELRQQSIESAYTALNEIRRLVDPANMSDSIPIDASILRKLQLQNRKRKNSPKSKNRNVHLVEEKIDNHLPLKDYNTKIIELESQLRQLSADRRELKQLLHSAQDEISEKENLNSELEEKLGGYEDLKHVLDTTKRESSEKDRVISEFEAKLNGLFKEREELQNFLESAENELNEKDAAFDNQKQLVEELNAKNANLEKEFLSLKALVDMQEIVQQEHTRIERSFSGKEEQMDKMVTELKAQNSALKQEVLKLKDEVAAIKLNQPEAESDPEEADKLEIEELKIQYENLLEQLSNLKMENTSLHQENVDRIQAEKELSAELEKLKADAENSVAETKEIKLLRNETNPQMGKDIEYMQQENTKKDESKEIDCDADSSDLFSVGSDSDCSQSKFRTNISQKLWEIELERVLQQKDEAEQQVANLENLLLKSQEQILKLSSEHDASVKDLSNDREGQKKLVNTLKNQLEMEKLNQTEFEHLVEEKNKAEKKVANLERLLLKSQENILKMSKEHDESVNELTKGLEAVVLDCKNQKELVSTLQKQLDSSWFK
mmetsp:Transcript_400/g.519  ORF Transcript_400/g.519 Transcript_400/m.519 type:complete len:572 (-) Transcript_400:3855-5570(-)